MFRLGKKADLNSKKIGKEFQSLEQAEAYFNSYRTELLKQLESLAEKYPQFTPSYEAKSLKGLETLYYEIYIDQKIKEEIGQPEFKQLIDYYMAAVFVSLELAEWQVQEGLFEVNTYIDGIFYQYGSWSNIAFSNEIERNKKTERDALFRHFMDFIPEEEEYKYL